MISLCMIVKNEEKNIGECLESARGLADEIIVVDTGSNDKTIEIAKSYGAKIEHFAWTKDFSAARNYSISKASCQWIVWLDADDRVPAKTAEELRKKISTESMNKVFYLVICNTANEGKTGTRFSQIRVFPNNLEIRFQGKIHEHILPSVKKLNLIEEKCALEIFHTGYEDPIILKEKQIRNLDLFKEEYPDLMKMDSNAMFHYAVSLEIIEDYENALLWQKNAFEKAKMERYNYLETLIPQNIARILEELERIDEAMEYLDISLKLEPNFGFAINQKAKLFDKLGRKEEAVKWFGYQASFVQKVVSLPSDDMRMHVNALQFLGEHWKLEQPQIALNILKTLKNMLQGTPHNPFALAEIYVANNKAKEALDNLEFLKNDFGNKPEFAFLQSQALVLNGNIQEAINAVSKAKEKFPQNSDIAELAIAMGV
ncbi:MAG: glycosyltransferase [Fibromonadales bacterium]|nr:glycosyltransferase [Fibromonadales bacterium]